MKITFKNLGTIKQTTLDLRPLTVIIGPNNTNKTYLAYSVHGLASTAEDPESWPEWGDHDVPLKLADIAAETQLVLNSRVAKFATSLPEYFQDTYGGLFKTTELHVEIDPADIRRVFPQISDSNLGLFTFDDTRVVVHGIKKNRRSALAWYAALVANELLGTPLTLPAERNALVITYKVLSARRYRILRDHDRSRKVRLSRTVQAAHDREHALLREQGDIRYPAPTEEFLDFLTDVELAHSPQNDPRSPFGRLASRIEDSIQAGHRTGYEATTLGGRELALKVSDTLRIDLYNASSSIKQLAPLLLYLRYRAAPGQLLIIDEPEMNLHPEGQAKLLEALAMLSNLGVHVLLTTHSPYIMAHLNNLIAADAESKPRRTRQAKHLYLGSPDAFLPPDAVSAYEMRPDGLATLADPEYGIRWDTLSDVSAELQRRYFAIVEEPEKRAKKRRT